MSRNNPYSRPIEVERDRLEAENARLQARVEELEGRLEKDRLAAIEHIDDHLKADCVVCGSPYKALAERRGEALEFYAAHANWTTYILDGEERLPKARYDRGGKARAAITATPEEALKIREDT